MKRIALLILTNIAVVVMLGIVLTVVSMLTGINFGQMAGMSLNVGALFVFALVVGFAGSIISLFMSKSMAKMTMGVQLINTDNPSPGLEQWLLVCRCLKSASTKVNPTLLRRAPPRTVLWWLSPPGF